MFATIKQTIKWTATTIGFFIVAILIWRRRGNFQEILTYKDAIAYFAENKPTASVNKAVIIRKLGPAGTYLISQLFLDKNDQIMTKPDGSSYGRNLRVRHIDAELLEAFGDKDVIVVI